VDSKYLGGWDGWLYEYLMIGWELWDTLEMERNKIPIFKYKQYFCVFDQLGKPVMLFD